MHGSRRVAPRAHFVAAIGGVAALLVSVGAVAQSPAPVPSGIELPQLQPHPEVAYPPEELSAMKPAHVVLLVDHPTAHDLLQDQHVR